MFQITNYQLRSIRGCKYWIITVTYKWRNIVRSSLQQIKVKKLKLICVKITRWTTCVQCPVRSLQIVANLRESFLTVIKERMVKRNIKHFSCSPNIYCFACSTDSLDKIGIAVSWCSVNNCKLNIFWSCVYQSHIRIVLVAVNNAESRIVTDSNFSVTIFNSTGNSVIDNNHIAHLFCGKIIAKLCLI